MNDERLPYRVTEIGAAYDSIATLPLVILLDNVRSAYNVGAFFRTADAIRADRLCLAGITPRPPHAKIAKTALGAEQSVRWEAVSDVPAALAALRGRGYELAAVETSVRAVDLFDWQPSFPVCVLFGHEVDGLSRSVLGACDTHIRIPMLGAKHSLNVATAGGVVLYELLRKYRDRLRG
ncbi:MAG: RNA methyltransferase [Bacteroidales bacterium]